MVDVLNRRGVKPALAVVALTGWGLSGHAIEGEVAVNINSSPQVTITSNGHKVETPTAYTLGFGIVSGSEQQLLAHAQQNPLGVNNAMRTVNIGEYQNNGRPGFTFLGLEFYAGKQAMASQPSVLTGDIFSDSHITGRTVNKITINVTKKDQS